VKNNFFKFITFLLLIGFLFIPTPTFADDEESVENEPGQLIINPQSIQGGQSGARTQSQVGVIGHELAPFLFLDDMTEVEALRIEQNELFLREANESLFLQEIPLASSSTREFVSELFLNEESFTHRSIASFTPNHYFHIPPWIAVIGVVSGIGILTCLAVILGQKLGHMIHKKKEEEVNG